MFNYCGKENKIKNAILVLNQEGFRNSLYEKILNADQFTHTTLENESIADHVHRVLENKPICINVYYPKWRWSKAIGYFSTDKPNQININGYKLKNLSVDDLVCNFVHESVHMASCHSSIKFDHGSNSPKGKQGSAPYSIGEMAKALIDEARRK